MRPTRDFVNPTRVLQPDGVAWGCAIVFWFSPAPENLGLTDVGKLSILKDEKIVFFAQGSQDIDDRWLKVIEYIDVCLDCRVRSRICPRVWVRSP